MKKTCAGIAALAALFVTPAIAADMAVKAPPPAPAPALSWTGCYAGIEAGYGWARDPNHNESPGANDGLLIGNVKAQGAVVGGTIGCNLQTNNWVVGIEDDMSANALKGSVGDLTPFNPTFSQAVQANWLDTLRVRLGFAVDRTLFYVTGGGAFAAIRDSSYNIAGAFVSQTNNVAGWTAGGGVEYMLPFRNWSAKAEYLYVGFPSRTNNYPAQNPAFVITKTQFTENIFRLGLNYKFY
jgi:outer membrane immunogenic protein